MAAASYVPGAWLGIVRSGTAVLLDPDAPPALVHVIWDLLADRQEVHEVLHAVTSSSGGSLASIPSFGILDLNGSLRVFLRGDLELTVQLSDGPVELHGRDVTTWNERRFALPEQLTLTVPGTRGGNLPHLPLAEGVILLQALSLRPAGEPPAAGPGPKSKPAAITTPEAAGPAAGEPEAAESEPVERTAAEPEAEEPPAAGPAPGPTPEPDQKPSPDRESDAVPDPMSDPDPVGRTRVPEVTLFPDHGVSAETIGGVPSDDAAAQADLTGSYDHLWERTVMRSIEDAAVREEPEEDHDRSVPALAPAPVAPVGQPGREREEDPGAPLAEAPAAPAAAAAPAADGVLIESVPWRTGGATSLPAGPVQVPVNQPPVNQAPANQPPVNQVPVNDPPKREAPVAHVPVGPLPGTGHADGDHDGQTVMKSSVARTAVQAAPVPAPGDRPEGPQVLARLCTHGHPNPPTRTQCAGCGGALLPDAVQVARPRLGRMRLSTGDLLDLDQSMVIGRQPSVSRVQGGVMPRLVQVASPGGDISRSHVEVRLEGWHVMLCDLKATNGTVLVREGQAPRRLAQNEMAILLDGDIAELGDNISLRFEEIP